MTTRLVTLFFASWSLFGVACASSPEPTDPASVPFGTTAIVVVVNPAVNDANAHVVPMPGAARAGVTVATDDHVSATTDAAGIAVLAPVAAGMRTISVSGGGTSGSVAVSVASGALLELALASDAAGTQLMVQVDYKTDQAVQVAPTMTTAEVNAILKVSDRVVFFAGGHYTGDLEFSGSRVTLFGEGSLGGRVFLDGNLKVAGSDSRIRGTRIMGNLTVTGSGVGISFSRIDGTTTATSSDGRLLANALCGADSVTGSGTIALGNAGMPPMTTCP